MSKKRTIVVTLRIIIVGIIVSVYYLLNQNPLSTTGFSWNDQRTKVTLDLVNNGKFNIKMVEISVNGKDPTTAQLVLIYSGQLASSALIQEDPMAKFIDIDKGTIHPKLRAKQVQKALLEGTKPIHYGLDLMNNEKITEITVRYKYLGIRYERKINLDTWPE
ncbi:hypothetical protein [Cohnella panacarvi]|uniref:hypothetical protein n=1 Tax=Cohnella panacarvi TaxID=400776 RepID=UPI000479859F|nr:hypothetical protein [Cohnella panacarvi]